MTGNSYENKPLRAPRFWQKVNTPEAQENLQAGDWIAIAFRAQTADGLGPVVEGWTYVEYMQRNAAGELLFFYARVQASSKTGQLRPPPWVTDMRDSGG